MKALAPLKEATKSKLTAKAEAIKAVLARDKTDKAAIQTDFDAAASEISKRFEFIAKRDAW